MSDFDYLSLDGRSLRVLLTVLEERSVTAAAERLGVTQSAVSHTLDKLRQITRDPLFVKSGRGIVATAHAEGLAVRARALLDDMKSLARGIAFEPEQARFTYTVAANDYQRDLFLPGFYRQLARQAPGIALKVVASGIPGAEVLRENRCDLLLTPRPPEGSDIHHHELLADHLVCFYDPGMRPPPDSREAFLAAGHIGLRFEESDRADFEKELRALGIFRDVRVTVPNVAGVPPFMRGTELLAVLPSLLHRGLMADFAWVEAPFELPPLSLYMVWHQRNHLDPAHRWTRELLSASCHSL